MTTDRLALAHVIEEAGIPRDGAERVASAIFDAIHDNVATKQDIESVRADIAAGRADTENAKEVLGGIINLVEHRLIIRLGGLMAALAGVPFVALHYWPPAH